MSYASYWPFNISRNREGASLFWPKHHNGSLPVHLWRMGSQLIMTLAPGYQHSIVSIRVMLSVKLTWVQLELYLASFSQHSTNQIVQKVNWIWLVKNTFSHNLCKCSRRSHCQCNNYCEPALNKKIEQDAAIKLSLNKSKYFILHLYYAYIL